MRNIKRTIVTILMYSKDGRLLMGKKDPKSGGVYSDCWHLPGGGVKEGENKLDAVKREVMEEVGIDVTPYRTEFVTDADKGIATKTLPSGEIVKAEMQFHVYKIVLDDKNASDVKLKFGDDLVEGRWFAISELKSVKMTPPSTRYFKKIGYV